jgi:hypothetical protein
VCKSPAPVPACAPNEMSYTFAASHSCASGAIGSHDKNEHTSARTDAHDICARVGARVLRTAAW